MDRGKGGAAVQVHVGKAEGIDASSRSMYVEVTQHDEASSAPPSARGGSARATGCNPSTNWGETLTLPVEDLHQGYLKVSVRSGVPLTEEDLAELAFQGKGSPSPVGYVRVPKADLQGLERSRPFELEGTANDAPASITLGFAVGDDDGDHDDAAAGGGEVSPSSESARPSVDRSVARSGKNSSDCLTPPPSDDRHPGYPERATHRGGGFGRGLEDGRSESGAGQGGGSPRGGDGSYFSSGRGNDVGSESGGEGEERRGGVAAAAVAETGGWSDRSDSDSNRPPSPPPLEGAVAHESATSGDDEDEALDGYTASRGAICAGSDEDDGWLEDSEEDGGSPGQVRSGGGSGGGSGRNASDKDTGGRYGGGSSSSDSSCDLDLSSANPIAVGDLWGDSGGVALGASGDARRSGARGGSGVGNGDGDGGSVGGGGGDRVGGGAAAMMSTPERYALRMEILRATVAATVAEVAAETYTTSGRGDGGGFSAMSSSTAIDSVSHFERDARPRSNLPSTAVESLSHGERDGRPRMSLPLAGSRSPRRGVTAAVAFPGRREPESGEEEEDSTATGLNRVAAPGRRQPGYYSNASSSDLGLPETAVAAVAAAAAAHREPGFYSDPSSSEVGLTDPAVAAAVAAVTAAAVRPSLGLPLPPPPPGLSALRVASSPPLPLPPLREKRVSTRGRRQPQGRSLRETDERRTRDVVSTATVDASSTEATSAAVTVVTNAAAPVMVDGEAAGSDGYWASSSMAASASLDPYSSHADVSGSRSVGVAGRYGISSSDGGGGVGEGIDGERQRERAGHREGEDGKEEKEEGDEPLREDVQPRNRRWLIDNYADRDGLGAAVQVDGDGGDNGDAYWNGLLGNQEATVGRQQGAAAGLETGRNKHRVNPAAVTAATRLPSHGDEAKPRPKVKPKANTSPERLPKGGRRRVAEAEAGVAGLRSTHFAPGYLGVAWPDPGGRGRGTGSRNPSVARAGILTKLEEAARRKMVEVEERARRARRERAHRLKRR
eukprot:jgi/Undpi1/2183/HiC_scaffold_12.g05569.m1